MPKERDEGKASTKQRRNKAKRRVT
jgi:hypothetical protein